MMHMLPFLAREQHISFRVQQPFGALHPASRGRSQELHEGRANDLKDNVYQFLTILQFSTLFVVEFEASVSP